MAETILHQLGKLLRPEIGVFADEVVSIASAVHHPPSPVCECEAVMFAEDKLAPALCFHIVD